MMRVYEIENVLNDGNDDEKGGDLCKRAEPANSPFFANYQKLLHRVGCRSLLQVTMGGLALTLSITSAKVSTRGKFCLFHGRGIGLHAFYILEPLQIGIQDVPKNALIECSDGFGGLVSWGPKK